MSVYIANKYYAFDKVYRKRNAIQEITHQRGMI
jgi:hypothetical protein